MENESTMVPGPKTNWYMKLRSMLKRWVIEFIKDEEMLQEKDNSKVDDFLLAEFNALQARARHLDEVKASKVNFFLLVVGIAGTWFGGIVNNQGIQNIDPAFLTILTLPLFIYGFLTFQFIVHQSVIVFYYYRLAGRIRLWFVEKNPLIARYVAFEYSDEFPKIERPRYGRFGGEIVLFVVNTLTFTGFVVSLLKPADWVIAIPELIISSSFGWALQWFYYARYLKNFENKEWVKADIHFPYYETLERFEKKEYK